MNNFKSSGFTLVEVILVVLIVAVVAGVGSQFALKGVETFYRQDTRDDMSSIQRLALERMAREIRNIRSAAAADIPVMTAADLRFTDIAGQDIRFTYAAGSLTRNTQPLAGSLTSFAFRYLMSDGATVTADPTQLWFVEIAYTVSKAGESMPARLLIHPRNF